MKIKLKYVPSLILTVMTVFGAVVLTTPYARATNPDSAEARVVVDDACTFNDNYDYTFTFSAMNGTVGDTTSETRSYTDGNIVKVTCNNITGFKIKAIGFSPDAAHATGYDGNTDMYSPTTSAVIPTGTATSGATSAWAMRITSASVTSPTGTGAPTATIQTPFATWASVPSSATTVIQFGGSTTSPVEGNMRADYQYYISQSQPAGTYTGKVKYTIVGD
ncbi:MAG: hypothetical protein Q4F58_02070 [Candidatus Saccharibacteria bacterium]|nr:hypothetical protein [Candidatus Saccharibacteria bacterium]